MIVVMRDKPNRGDRYDHDDDDPYDDDPDDHDPDDHDPDDHDLYDDGDDDFDYDQFVEDNYGHTLTNTATKPIWRLVAVVMLVLIGLSVMMQFGAIF